MVSVICTTKMLFEKLKVLIYVSASFEELLQVLKKSLFGNHFLLSFCCVSSVATCCVSVRGCGKGALLPFCKAVQMSSRSFSSQIFSSLICRSQPCVVKEHKCDWAKNIFIILKRRYKC